jgi:serine/threonine protein kinase
MPPEQVDGGASDPRGDIFSAGTVFYELLSGARAFGGGRMHEILDRVANHDPLPIHQVDDRLPEELSAIVRTAMAKDPDERYQSVSEMLDAINDFEATLADWRRELQEAISARLAPLGPRPPGNAGPPDLQIPTRLPQGYLELVALRQYVDDRSEAIDELAEELAWVEGMLTAALDELDDETLRGIANRADSVRQAWPGEPRASELGHRVLDVLRARLPLREPVRWGNAGQRPGKQAG